MSVRSSPLPDSAALKQLVLRHRLLIHLTAFIFFELSFITLAVVCLRTPLPCSFSSSSTLPKATFTIIFIVWQTLANMSAQNIVAHGFSSEWSILLAKTGKLAPGYTDVVSYSHALYYFMLLELPNSEPVVLLKPRISLNSSMRQGSQPARSLVTRWNCALQGKGMFLSSPLATSTQL